MVIESIGLNEALKRVDILLDAICFGKVKLPHSPDLPLREELIEALNAIRHFQESL